MNGEILIIEDDIVFSKIVENFLKRYGYKITATTTIEDALYILEKNSFDLILLDYRLPDGSGKDIVSFTRTRYPQLAIIMMTSFYDVKTAVKMVKMGVQDYITKPVNQEELLVVIREALHNKAANPTETSFEKTKPENSYIIGRSDIARKIQDHIKIVGPTNLSVIIQGDSGTGKEQAARSIHQNSHRADQPFVAIDCGTLSNELAASALFGYKKGAFTGALQDKKGHILAADKGTLFLDEVANLSYEVQVKLLRIIQEREVQPVGSNEVAKVDIRIIAATNEDLSNAVKKGTFREDLYHRLNEFKIHLPALQDRMEDLSLFIHHFIQQSNAELGKQVEGVSDAVHQLFLAYSWPGNLRELRNIIRRAVLLTQTNLIHTESLPDEMVLVVTHQPKENITTDLKKIQNTTEKELIEKTLVKVKYNKSKAAKLLNIDRTTLYNKIEKYGIDV